MNNWKTIVLMALNGAGAEEKEAEMQIRVITPMIEHLLEEQRKDLINQILSEAPEDRDTAGVVTPYTNYGFNQANALWKSNIKKLI